MAPGNLKYTRRNEWCREEPNRVVVFGLTERAAAHLNEVLFIELPNVGDDVLNDVPCGEIESSESTMFLYSPADGEVIEVNPRVLDTPELVAKDPFGDGWLVKIRAGDQSQLQDLLSATEYAERQKRQR